MCNANTNKEKEQSKAVKDWAGYELKEEQISPEKKVHALDQSRSFKRHVQYMGQKNVDDERISVHRRNSQLSASG